MSRLIRFASILGLILLPGCGDGTGPGSIAGTYRLRTIGQAALPTVVSGIEILSATLAMQDEGTWTLTYTFRTTPGQGQAQTESLSGRYTLFGIQLTLEGDFDIDGTYQNGTIGLDIEGETWVFRK